jgi:hypothetical protein
MIKKVAYAAANKHSYAKMNQLLNPGRPAQIIQLYLPSRNEPSPAYFHHQRFLSHIEEGRYAIAPPGESNSH